MSQKNRFHRFYVFVPGVILATSSWSSHAESLPTVVVESSLSPDWLAENPLLPTHSSRDSRSGLGFQSPNGKGTIADSLTKDLGLGVTSNGTAGSANQFRGLGRSADETQIQALGIPLNPPQGGGFDFSSFPAFLWSDYRFQQAPSHATADPRATSGTLQLRPWTLSALDDGHAEIRETAAISSEGDGSTQVSLGASDGHALSGLIGHSEGDERGYSGALSARAHVDSTDRLDFHLLFTDVIGKTRGSRSFRTPNGTQETARGMPVLQWTSSFGKGRLLQAHAYADWQFIGYDDRISFSSRDHGFAAGGTLALDWDQWRIGAGYRNFSYLQLGQSAVDEQVGSVHASKVFELDSEFKIEPSLQGTSVSRSGFYPGGSLTLRMDPHWSSEMGAVGFYSTASYARRFPTLLDQVDVPPYSIANKTLRPEKNETILLGVEATGGTFAGSLEAYWQARQDSLALYTNPTTFLYQRINAGVASVRALSLKMSDDFAPMISARTVWTLTGSEVENTGGRFPYLPALQGNFFVELHSLGAAEDRRWSVEAGFQGATERQVNGPNDRLPTYTVWEIGSRYALVSRNHGVAQLDLYSRISDIFNQKPDPAKGYDGAGRSLVVGLMGSI